MKCYLHIGTEKTGTTTIQNFFFINRALLPKQKFFYITPEGHQSHLNLVISSYNPNHVDDFIKSMDLSSKKKFESFRQATIENFSQNVKSHCDNTSTIIISSEHIQSRLTHTDELYRLKQTLLDVGVNKIYVLLYIRRPAEIANSLFSTAVRTGSRYLIPPKPTESYWHNICHHKNTILRFATVFGESSLIPRIYKKNILTDVMQIINLDSSNLSFPQNLNKSLSAKGIRLLSYLNSSIPKYLDNGKTNPMRKNLTSYIEKFLSKPAYRMSKEKYIEYDEAFKDSDEWVHQKYFQDLPSLFDYDLPESNMDSYGSIIDTKTVSDILSDIWLNMNKNI